MKTIFIVGLILFAGCAGANTSSTQGPGEFDPATCKNIPLGIEEYEALDPSSKEKPIKCSDLERCAAIAGQTPPDIPCE